MKSQPIPFKTVPDLELLKTSFPGLKAIFFDMDGTLFNTEKYHEEALNLLGQKYSIIPPHSPDVVFELLVGKADHLVYDIIKSWGNFPKHWTVEEFIKEKNANLLRILASIKASDYFPTELQSLIEAAKKENLFLALITSSEKAITQELLNITKITPQFNLILTRDDCPFHKPDPWPYLKAIEITGLLPTEVLIFEDSKVGLEAATATGSHVIKVEWY